MSHQSRAIFLFLTIIAVLLVSAVGTTNVYADDGTPPPPPAETEVVDQPTGEPVVPSEAVEEVVATAEPVEPAATVEPTEVVPTEEAPVVEEQAPAEEAATILEQVPDNIEVTVLNAEGEAQPLTTQESADAIVTSDPIWCPSTQTTPTPGANGCTPSFGSFDELLTYVADPANAITGAGTIYVEMGDYAGTESVIDFNNYVLTNISSANLTVQGGWNTGDNTTTSVSNFDVPIVIGSTSNPWAGTLTINNLVIDGVEDQTGLTLVSSNNITLTNVTVTNSKGGADLNSGKRVRVTDSNFNNNKEFGAKIQAGTLADILNSNFNDNKSDDVDAFGLEIDSLRASLEGVNAINNEAFGADIDSDGEIYIVDSVFSGNIGFDKECVWIGAKGVKTCHWECKVVNTGNGYGLKAVSAESVYLDGVTAEGNYLFGAYLEGPVVDVVNEDYGNNTFSGNGSGSLDNPTGYGLKVVSTGAVTLRGVTANNNQLFGANIQTDGYVKVIDSFFSGNKSYTQECKWVYAKENKANCHEVCVKDYQGYGLQVDTEGEILLRQVTASDNYLFGAHLNGAGVTVVGNTVDGVLYKSVFSNNGSGTETLTGEGLQIVATEYVTLSDVETNGNQLFGTNIAAVGNVAIQNSLFNGQKHTYGSVTTGGYGLKVVTDGQIAVEGIEANNNYLFGALLDGGDAGVGIAVKDSSFSNNKSGLEIIGAGAVNLEAVTANENSLFGASIQTLGNVVIKESFFNGNASYVSNCKGKTYNGYGLRVVTTGTIELNTVEANENYVYGAYLEGTTITVFNSSFSDNSTGNLADHIGSGLEIKSTGSEEIVTLDGVTASNNQLFGANVTAEGLVIVQNSVFNGNMSYASSCGSKSSVGTSTSTGKSTGGVKPTCQQNCTKTYYGYGLQVVTTGNIEVVNVTADGNYLFGARLDGAKVDVYDSEFNSNASPVVSGQTPTGRGLEVISTGDTLLSGVTASDNQLFGADVKAGGNVQVLSSIFSNNKYSVSCSTKGYGLKVVVNDPASTITLNDVTALGNGAEGVNLNGQAAINVTDSLFNNNGANGLDITAQGGTVTLTNLEAIGNKGNGVSVKGTCDNVVNVNGGTFEDNSQYGIKVVDAEYLPNSANMPSFDGNGSGDFFQSDCVSSGGGSGGGTGTGGGTGGSGNGGGWNGWNGWNWWYWWWFWHYGHR